MTDQRTIQTSPGYRTTSRAADLAVSAKRAREERWKEDEARKNPRPHKRKDGLDRLVEAGEIGAPEEAAGRRFHRAFKITQGGMRSSLDMSPRGEVEDAIQAHRDAASTVARFLGCCSTVMEKEALLAVCGWDKSISEAFGGGSKHKTATTALVGLLQRAARAGL